MKPKTISLSFSHKYHLLLKIVYLLCLEDNRFGKSVDVMDQAFTPPLQDASDTQWGTQ